MSRVLARVSSGARRTIERWWGAPHSLPILLCIDVEPDPRWPPRQGAPAWRGFAASLERFAALGERWRQAGGGPARFAWFLRMDPLVALCYRDAGYVMAEFGSAIRELERQGHEIGLHVHASRWSEERSEFFGDHGDPAWVAHCVRTGLQAFAKSTGRPCRSFRFGDGWSSQATIEQLAAAGVRYELTAEPEAPARPSLVAGEPGTGRLPGWCGIPRRPYQPADGDYLRPASRRRGGLWIVPMSAGPEDPAAGQIVYRTLNLTLEPRLFRRIATANLDRSSAPYLGLMVRTDAALDGPDWESVRANLDFLATVARTRPLRWVRPGELVAALDGE